MALTETLETIEIAKRAGYILGYLSPQEKLRIHYCRSCGGMQRWSNKTGSLCRSENSYIMLLRIEEELDNAAIFEERGFQGFNLLKRDGRSFCSSLSWRSLFSFNLRLSNKLVDYFDLAREMKELEKRKAHYLRKWRG